MLKALAQIDAPHSAPGPEVLVGALDGAQKQLIARTAPLCVFDPVEQFGPEEGLYYPATIVTGLDREMIRGKGESFAPLALVLKVASAEEAIEIANESDLGLVASLWTQDMSKAWRVAEALPHGAVNVNETSNYWDQLAPFGGAGNSGVGRELSEWFLQSFTEPKLIVFDLGGPPDDRRIEGGW